MGEPVMPREIQAAWASLALFMLCAVLFDSCPGRADIEGPITPAECESICAPCDVSKQTDRVCRCKNPRAFAGCE